MYIRSIILSLLSITISLRAMSDQERFYSIIKKSLKEGVINDKDIQFLKIGKFDVKNLDPKLFYTGFSLFQGGSGLFSWIIHVYLRDKIHYIDPIFSIDDLQEIFDHFLKLGANINEKDSLGKAENFFAGIMKDPNILLILLHAGYNPNIRMGEDNWSLLQVALATPEIDNPAVLGRILEILAQKQFVNELINAQDRNGRTPLMTLVEDRWLNWETYLKNAPKNLKILMRYKADPFIRDNFGRDAVDYLRSWSGGGKNSQDIFKQLIKTLQDYKYSFGIHKAASQTQQEPVTVQSLEQLSEEQKKEAIIMPQQSGLRNLIADYVIGELTDEEKRRLQQELKQEGERKKEAQEEIRPKKENKRECTVECIVQ